jgi:hypothetical protein
MWILMAESNDPDMEKVRWYLTHYPYIRGPYECWSVMPSRALRLKNKAALDRCHSFIAPHIDPSYDLVIVELRCGY